MPAITTLATGAERLAELQALTVNASTAISIRNAMQAAKRESLALTVSGTEIAAQAYLALAYDAAIKLVEVSVRVPAGG